MRLSKNFKTDIEDLNIVLYRKVVIKPKNKEEYEGWRRIGFFGSWEHVFTRMLNIAITENIEETEITILTEIVDAINNAKEEIKKCVDNLKNIEEHEDEDNLYEH
jgi:transcription initiation factor IIE alpha subunit